MRKEGVNKIKKGDIEYTFTAVEKGKAGSTKTPEERAAEKAQKIADRLAKKEANIAAAKAKKEAGFGVPGGKRGRPAKAKPVESADEVAGDQSGSEEAA